MRDAVRVKLIFMYNCLKSGYNTNICQEEKIYIFACFFTIYSFNIIGISALLFGYGTP